MKINIFLKYNLIWNKSEIFITNLTCLNKIEMNELNEKKDWIQIGSGQFGKVFKAIYNNSKTIAVKVNI